MAGTLEKQTTLQYLKDLWDEDAAAGLDDAELLRYRSNLLGADLRNTNFAGGNTSSKVFETDPLTGEAREVIWVKGSGGDLGSMKRAGLATLYLEKFHALEQLYRGVDFEDEMVEMYPLCTFKNNPVAASIDTPLHGFLPFRHVDHLHPDWGIALAASANGLEKMSEFNQRFGHDLVWIPWQRPGFELGLMMKRTVAENPGCDGIVLGGHGLFTWGDTHRESYLNTITLIDQLGQFVNEHVERKGDRIFGGVKFETREDSAALVLEILPFLRGQVSGHRRVVCSYSKLPEVLKFVNSHDGEALAYLGTSCPDHFIRTKIRPLYIKWDPSGDVAGLKKAITEGLENYRTEYAQYYQAHVEADSPAMRDDNPSIVLIPGLGMFSFGKSKPESRITGEFYTNAIHVMEGASAMGDGAPPSELPQAGPAAPTAAFKLCSNYVALPAREAFRIEYWKMEEAKIRRQPREKELSRQIAVIVGGGSGIGREVALLAAARGAHVVVADPDIAGAEAVTAEVKVIAGTEFAVSTGIDIGDRKTVREAIAAAVGNFGGLDILIDTSALRDGQSADEASKVFKKQGLPASVVLTGPADVAVLERGGDAGDSSDAAIRQVVRELAVGLAPLVRVNGITAAAAFEDTSRTVTQQPSNPIHLKDCAETILFLAGPASHGTTGHVIPVDGGARQH